jgi:hypothetical protein
LGLGHTGEFYPNFLSNFVRAINEAYRARSLRNAKIRELDLMTGDLPTGVCDFSWCRWVASFVTDPALLIKKLHDETWRFFPRLPKPRTLQGAIETSRESGRTGFCSRITVAPVGERLCRSLGQAAYVLHPSY